MSKALSIGLLAIGVLLIALGLNAADSLASDVKRFFSGNPTDKSVWLLIGGVLVAVVGLGGLATGRRRTA